MNFLLGVSGSSGVFDLPTYLRIFRKDLTPNIRMVITPTVKNFVEPQFLHVFAPDGLYDDFFDRDSDVNVPHNDLLEWADVFAVLPCTANTLAKSAHGITDNLLTMLVLCSSKPVLFFPNMNADMWNNKATQRNVNLLLEFGHRVIRPSGNGWITATGEATNTHMPAPNACVKYILNFLNTN